MLPRRFIDEIFFLFERNRIDVLFCKRGEIIYGAIVEGKENVIIKPKNIKNIEVRDDTIKISLRNVCTLILKEEDEKKVYEIKD